MLGIFMVADGHALSAERVLVCHTVQAFGVSQEAIQIKNNTCYHCYEHANLQMCILDYQAYPIL
jgi:hypothetical protein